MGTCIRTPAVTAITPRMKARSPRRSESVLALITGRPGSPMCAGEGGGCTEQAGLWVNDDLDRHFVHYPLEASLGDKAIAETRARQVIGQPQAEPSGQHHGMRTLGEREIAGGRPEDQAEVVERRCCQR